MILHDLTSRPVRLSQRLATAFILCLLLGISGLGIANEKAGTPKITDHSQTSFAVYRGDKITLEVKAVGENLQAKWLRTKQVVCREFTCEFDTAEWDLGTQKMTFVVFNDKGSKFLRFNIRVMAPPADYVTGRVQPENIAEVLADEDVKAEDLRVYTMTGRGFSYNLNKLQVVGPHPRVLEWKESLKTQAKSALRFGRQDREMHVLGENSQVQLLATSSGRRALRLLKGTLRSRNLAGSETRWSLLVGDFAQIDTDESGDVLLTVDKKQVTTLTVLRGQARIFVRSDEGEGKGAKHDLALPGKVYAAPQGVSVKLATNMDLSQGLVFTQPPAKIGEQIIATTPEYFSFKGEKQESGADSLLKDKRPADYNKAIDLAVIANKARDYFVSIEALLPYLEKVKTSSTASLALGEAYKGIFVYNSAQTFLKHAEAADEEAAEPKFQLGELAMSQLKWDEAVGHLEAADERDYVDQQTLHYYLGVAHYHLGQKVSARHALTQSLWSQENSEVTAAATSAQAAVEDGNWFEVRLAGGVLSDNNVMHMASSAASIASGLDANKSAGYFGHAGFSLFPWRRASDAIAFNYDIENTRWLNQSLKSLAIIDQNLGFTFALYFGGVSEGADPAWLGLHLGLNLGMIYIGEERASDSVVSDVKLSSPAFFHAEILVRSLRLLDPIPGRHDILDPTLWEVVAVSDRSNQQTHLGLGLRPIDTHSWTVTCGMESRKIAYSDDFSKLDSFSARVLKLGIGYDWSLRSALLLDVKNNNRDFEESLDARKDSTLAYEMGWKWYFTPALHHILKIESEKNKSSRAANTYSRVVFGYRLNLNF